MTRAQGALSGDGVVEGVISFGVGFDDPRHTFISRKFCSRSFPGRVSIDSG